MGTKQTKPGDTKVHFSRSSIGGKKTSEVKFRCSDELKDELARRARELGFASESELGEFLVAVGLFGKRHVASFHMERLEKAAALFHEEHE